ncbi:MAG: ABC transporter permease, partial [Alistipes sp.]
MNELLLEIWASMRKNKLRTFLTGFSVAWGIFMLVILLGSGNGLKHGVLSNFGNYAINSINIVGGSTSEPYMGYEKGRHIKLKNSDLDILLKEFPEVQEVAATAWFSKQTASYGSEFMNTSLCGVLPKIEQIEGVKIVEGRFINDADLARYRKVVVIDQTMQQVLFKGATALGKKLKIGNTTYIIAGIYKGDANRMNATCYIPLSTGQLIYKGNNPTVEEAVFTVNEIGTNTDMDAFNQRVIARLAIEHHFDPTDQSAVWLKNNMEIFKSMSLVFNGITVFIWIIGLGTLFAGIVGVSNIMLVTVTERTAEFGVRKALGAKPSSIIRLILTESVLVTALFGYIGMVLGVAVMECVNYFLQQAPPSTSQFSSTMFLDPTLDLSVAISATV